MIWSIIIAGAIPLVFLYIVKWLNFFETHKLGLILLAFAWGVFASWLAYQVDHPLVPIFGRQFISENIAPTVEEVLKSLILVYLVRRADHTYFVDAAIYGFASGIGFAVSENLLYLSRVDVNTGLIVAIARAFSSSLMHGGSTALVGIAIGGFPLGRRVHPVLALVAGWILAVAYHMTYNRVTFTNFGPLSLFVISAAGFAGPLLAVGLIVWGLRRERKRLRRSLGMKAGVSKGEARLVQHIDDLDAMLAPVEARFGRAKRDDVAQVLLLGAQLAMKQDLIRHTRDPELRASLAPEITAARRELKAARHRVGIYVMSFARSILPRTTWSLWARLEARRQQPHPPGVDVWRLAAERVAASPTPAGPSLAMLALSHLDEARRADAT
ncbi:MAG: PrsW family intramembrane metalloprotease [Proteobacteria bacterium]|nr:PrsW family intramembrane metalloprotease [Pseudomonadota bacterium]